MLYTFFLFTRQCRNGLKEKKLNNNSLYLILILYTTIIYLQFYNDLFIYFLLKFL